LRLAASEQEAGGQTRSQLDSQDKGQIKGYTLGETGIYFVRVQTISLLILK